MIRITLLAALVALASCAIEPDYNDGRVYAPRPAPYPYWGPGYVGPGYVGRGYVGPGYVGPGYFGRGHRGGYAPQPNRGEGHRPPPGPVPRAATPQHQRGPYVPGAAAREPARVEQGAD